jgi:hypothetical protein
VYCTCIREKKRGKREHQKAFPNDWRMRPTTTQRRPGLYPSSFSTPDDMMKEKLNAVRCLVVINKHKENKINNTVNDELKKKGNYPGYIIRTKEDGGASRVYYLCSGSRRERERETTHRQYSTVQWRSVSRYGAVIIVPTIITQRQFPNSCPVLSTFVFFFFKFPPNLTK